MKDLLPVESFAFHARNYVVQLNRYTFGYFMEAVMFARYPFLKSPPKMILPAVALTMILSVIPSLSFAERGEAYEYLYEVMDRYHKKFYVYTNNDEGGNHFYPSGFMGSLSSIDINTNWVSEPYEGTSCIRVVFTAGDDPWAGVYWQEPENNWGTIPNAGYDLTGATEISFFAKGERGGEKVEFFAGGISGNQSDSLTKTSIGFISLEPGWREYKIDLTSKDLTQIIGGFGFVLQSTDNPNGATFYLDYIGYNKSRLDELRFLLSFQPIQSSDDPDRRLTNACFVYDNAVALLSFLARGTTEDLRRAKLLADAFLYAQDNDGYYSDGRLRNAYMSGDLIDHLTGKARIPGWWDTIQEKWVEEPLQASTHTGGVAWVIIALLSYYNKAGGQQYLQAAETLAEWIENKTHDNRCEGGYKGGFQGEVANVQQIEWKSTEHNIDVYAAFTLLYSMTNNSDWKNRAMHAKRFVDAMWNNADSHFWSGTADDGCSIDYDMGIHVDIHAWAPMALGNHNSALIGAESNCYTEADGFKGFDFNNDKDGVWFEGTAHMALAYHINGQTNNYNSYIAELRKGQLSALNANGKGIVAASHNGLTTGFDWEYHSRLHIGATAWYLFAEQRFNPFDPASALRKSAPWLPLLLSD